MRPDSTGVEHRSPAEVGLTVLAQDTGAQQKWGDLFSFLRAAWK